MIRRLHLRVDLRDVSLFVDQIGDALRVAGGGVRACAVRETERPLGIAEQREREVELLRERRVRRFVIEARAEDRDVLVRELLGSVTEPVALDRSTGGVGLRIKPQQDLAAAKIGQPDSLSFMGRDIELRGGIARLQHL